MSEHIHRKQLRFMGDGSAYNYIAMKEAIKDSSLEEKDVSNNKTGIITQWSNFFRWWFNRSHSFNHQRLEKIF